MPKQSISRIAFKTMGGRRFFNVTTMRKVMGLADGFFARIRRNRSGANAVKVTRLPNGSYQITFWRTATLKTPMDRSELVIVASSVNAKDNLGTFEAVTGLSIFRAPRALDAFGGPNLTASLALKSMEARPASANTEGRT